MKGQALDQRPLTLTSHGYQSSSKSMMLKTCAPSIRSELGKFNSPNKKPCFGVTTAPSIPRSGDKRYTAVSKENSCVLINVASPEKPVNSTPLALLRNQGNSRFNISPFRNVISPTGQLSPFHHVSSHKNADVLPNCIEQKNIASLTKVFLCFEVVCYEGMDSIRLNIEHSRLKQSTSMTTLNRDTSDVTEATHSELDELLKDLTFECHEKQNRDAFLRHCARAFLGSRHEIFHFVLRRYKCMIEVIKKFHSERSGRIANFEVSYLPKHILLEMERCIHRIEKNSSEALPEMSFSTEGLTSCMKHGASPFHIPHGLLSKLLPYQKDALQFAIHRCEGRVYIADDMGLGKTLEAISLSLHYSSHWPMLIITPSSLKNQWKVELEKWVPFLRSESHLFYSEKRKGEKNKEHCSACQKIALIEKSSDVNDFFHENGVCRHKSIFVYIISYALAVTLAKELKNTYFDLIICDEAHYLKGQEAKRSKAIKEIVSKASKVILLSGTPALSRPLELFSQIDMILQGRRKIPFKEYANRYCISGDGFLPENSRKDSRNSSKKVYSRKNLSPKVQYCMNKKDIYSGHAHLDELRWLLQKTCLIRRTKNQVLEQMLPQKKRSHVALHVKSNKNSNLQSSSDGSIVQSTSNKSQIASSNLDQSVDCKKTESVALFYETSLLKADAVCVYLSDYLTSCFIRHDDKIVIFAHHTEMLNRIEIVINSVRRDKERETDLYQYIRIDGATSISSRVDLIQRFQTRDDYKIALCSLLAVGVGVNFCAAKTCIFAELYWTPAVLIQAEDRIHRLGQKGSGDDDTDINNRSVEILYLIAHGTFDDALWPLVQKKLTITSKMLENSNNKMNFNVKRKEEKE